MKYNFELHGLMNILPFLQYECVQKCVQKLFLMVTFDLDH